MPGGFHQEDIKVGWLLNRLAKTRLIFGYNIVCMKVNVKIIENSLFKNLATNGEK